MVSQQRVMQTWWGGGGGSSSGGSVAAAAAAAAGHQSAEFKSSPGAISTRVAPSVVVARRYMHPGYLGATCYVKKVLYILALEL